MKFFSVTDENIAANILQSLEKNISKVSFETHIITKLSMSESSFCW